MSERIKSPTMKFGVPLCVPGSPLAGIVMNLNYHWKALPLPKWLVLVHAGIAVVGFYLSAACDVADIRPAGELRSTPEVSSLL